jgi:predicted phage terminase large subunit-like protein
VKYPSADFQREMFDLSEDESQEYIVISAFRGSGKSTIFSTSYPIWSVIGEQSKRFILLVSRTQEQSNLLLKNIKSELENNELLKHDLGPFEEVDDEWRSSSIVIPKYDARIMSISVGQSIRGIRHKHTRPDLIVCDDLEDVLSTKTQDSRDKLFNWFSSDLIPAGDLKTRVIVVGNLVHDDSLVMRLKERIENNSINGIYRSYPLIDDDGKCLWSEKYSSEEIIKQERAKVSDERFWQREYLLKIVPDEAQIIHREWLQFYTSLPTDKELIGVSVGVDLAISERSTADYTAMVPVLIYADHRNYRDISLYILPDIIHKRMIFPSTLMEIEKMNQQLLQKYKERPTFIVEDVGFQRAVSQEIEQRNVHAFSSKPNGSKRERLHLIAPSIEGYKVFFPIEGAEELINELIHFGSEKHDDLADALSMLIIEIIIHGNGYTPPLVFA